MLLYFINKGGDYRKDYQAGVDRDHDEEEIEGVILDDKREI